MTSPLTQGEPLSNGLSVFNYDAASQISNDGYSYDAQGRLTQSTYNDDTSTYSWDSASRLLGYGDVALTYNGLGGVRTRTEEGLTTRFHYNHAIWGSPIVAEEDQATSQILRYYVWTPVAGSCT
jgi:hypothetical protein